MSDKNLTRHQFEIIKILQAMGRTAKSLAWSFNEPISKIQLAYDSPNYRAYLKRSALAKSNPFEGLGL